MTVAVSLAALSSALLVACSSSSSAPEMPGPTAEARPAPSPGVAPAAQPESKAPKLFVQSSDLAVGPNRFAFAVLDQDNDPVREPEMKVVFLSLRQDRPQLRKDAMAMFHTWPSGGGLYAVDVTFDYDGPWGVLAQVIRQGVAAGTAESGFVVNAESSAPGIGKPVPASRNKTARDVSDLTELSSSPRPDPDLYRLTVAQAVASGLPTVVTFATPAFCQTATCGPQVEVVSEVKERHKGQANFIHVEVYDNPKEMHADFSKRVCEKQPLPTVVASESPSAAIWRGGIPRS